MKLRLKIEKEWQLTDKGIEISSTNRALSTIIRTDSNDKVFKFLDYLSEPRTTFEIEQFTLLSDSEKRDVIEHLIDKKHADFITDDIELNRTHYFLNTFPNCDGIQISKQLAETTIVIIGLGTVGSYLVDVLFRLGVKNFILADGDKVDPSNLSSQLFYSQDCGQYKVEVIKNRFENDRLSIATHTNFVRCLEEIVDSQQLSDVIVINAADDYKLMLELAETFHTDSHPQLIIECGYGPLLQSVYLIDSLERAKEFKDYIQLNLGKHDMLTTNSGSSLNGFLSAFFVGKIFLDYFIGRRTHTMSYNFFTDDLYVMNYLEKDNI